MSQQQLTVDQVAGHMTYRLFDWDCSRGEHNPTGMGFLVEKVFDILPGQPFTATQLASQIDQLVEDAQFVTDDGRVLVGYSAHSAYGNIFRPGQRMGFFILGGVDPQENEDPAD